MAMQDLPIRLNVQCLEHVRGSSSDCPVCILLGDIQMELQRFKNKRDGQLVTLRKFLNDKKAVIIDVK